MSLRDLTLVSVNLPDLNTKLVQIAEAVQLLTDAGILEVDGLTLPDGAANRVLASPDAIAGTVTLRALVAADIPNLAASKITSGQLVPARGGTGLDTSGSTGVPRASAGTWSVDAGISHLAASTSAALRGVLSDESGDGAALFQNGALGTPASGVATNLTGTASGLTAGTVTTNANLTGPITSAGNATAIASQTGTGAKFVMDTSPTIVTPTITTSETCPLVIGGTGTTSTLTLRPTSGIGTTNADIIAQVGNNGATEAMRILNSGSVGIGTTTVVDPITGSSRVKIVDGTMVFSFRDNSTGQGWLAISNGTITSLSHLNTTDGVVFGAFSNHNLVFRTNNINRVTFDTSGNVGIGVTPGAGKARLFCGGGTATATTDWALTSGWGANAAISAVTGTDARGTVTVQTSILDTPTLNPVITLTFKDGTWTSAPFAVTNMNSNSTGTMGASSSKTTATTLVLTYDGTPTALTAAAYIFNYIVLG